MAVIRVKRGLSVPTISQLSQVGEMGFDTTNNNLYIRGNNSVVKINGGVEELVYNFSGNVSSHTFNYNFENNYVYQIYVFASTNYKDHDTSQSIIQYKNNSGTPLYGSYMTTFYNDVYAGISKMSSRNIASFLIADGHSTGVTPSYAITKTIDFKIYPTFESNTTSTYQWIVKGSSVTSTSDQSNTPITLSDFVHSVDGAVGQLTIDTGLDLGQIDTIQISMYRKKR